MGGDEVRGGITHPNLRCPPPTTHGCTQFGEGGSQGDDIGVGQFHGNGEGVLPLRVHSINVSTTLQEEAHQAAMGRGGHMYGARRRIYRGGGGIGVGI